MKSILLTLSITISTLTFAQNYSCGLKYTKESLETQELILKEYRKRLENNIDINKTGNTFRIPIVFHIVHNFGPENIHDSLVHIALEKLNNDFRKRNADSILIDSQFSSLHKDMEIEFFLPCLDPYGIPTNGITRTVSTLTNNGNDTVKSLIQWNNTSYYNVWIVQSAVVGLSNLPGVPNNLDGTMLIFTQLGSLTHQTGHWLGLQHLWGNNNTPNQNFNCGIDDGIDDTPNTIGATVCNLNLNTCYDTLYYGYDIKDNVQNYLEYTFCIAGNFTLGQKALCHTTLYSTINGRNNIWSASNLIYTAIDSSICGQTIPISNFYVENDTICDQDTVHFMANAYNSDVINYSWLFPGGTPSTSSDTNPEITYSIPGTYPAILIVSNSFGSDTSNTNITVNNCTGLYINENILSFRISPNPTNGGLIIYSFESEEAQYKITSIDGSLIQKGNLNGNQTRIHLAQKGMYLIQLLKGSAVSKTKKIIIN